MASVILRALLASAGALAVLFCGLAPADAFACSDAGTEFCLARPAHGEVVSPQLPGIVFQVPYGVDANGFELLDADGGSVPLTVEQIAPFGLGAFLARPAGGLQPESTYRLRAPCVPTFGGDGGQLQSEFETGPNQPFPASIGTLTASPVKIIPDAGNSTSCGYGAGTAAISRLSFVPTPEFEALYPTAVLRLSAPGVWWSTGYYGARFEEIIPTLAPRMSEVMAFCNGSGPRGLKPGLHTFELNAVIPGAQLQPPPATVTLDLYCGAGTDAGAVTALDGSLGPEAPAGAGGCSASGASLAGLLAALLFAGAVTRRRPTWP